MCIDLKSFYASVECVQRGLDPLNTNLVVADEMRTEKTICLAVSPSLKKYGIKGRARLFEVVSKIREINKIRRRDNNYRKFTGKSYLDDELIKDKSLELDYIVAVPQMKKYMDVSASIYNIYLRYLSKDDIYVYSIDEVFCDITNYLKMYNLTPTELVTKIIKDVYMNTGITATAGIGTNMYLAKVSMDIVAKHKKADEIGVRIATLNEMSYRKLLWNHKPLTDFWRVGSGISKKLEKHGMYTMGDVARMSLENEDLLYKLFGVNAELLIDHAWGYEPVTMSDVKAYTPEHNSISQGQVLHCAYTYEQTKLIVKEMLDMLALDLTDKRKVTCKLVLDVGYDINNVKSFATNLSYDRYGRVVPKPAHGTINLDFKTSSSHIIMKKGLELFEKITNRKLLIKRINITAVDIVDEGVMENEQVHEQLNLFSILNDETEKSKKEQKEEIKLQNVILTLKDKYGKNSVLKAMNLEEGSTMKERNNQVGGHRG